MNKCVSIILVILIHVPVFGANGNNITELSNQLQALQAQLTNLQSSLGEIEVPVAKTTLEQIKDVAEKDFAKEEIPYSTFEKYNELLVTCEDEKCLDEKGLEFYHYFGAKTVLEYFVRKFYDPYLKRDLDPLSLQKTLPLVARKVSDYFGEEGNFKDVLQQYGLFLKAYRDNKPSGDPEVAQKLHELSLIYENLLNLTLRNTINHFDDDEQYKGDGLSNQPYTKDDLELYTYALKKLKKFLAAIDKKEPLVESYESWAQELPKWVDKGPVKTKKPSPKEQVLLAQLQRDILQAKSDYEKNKKAFMQNQQRVQAIKKKLVDYRTILENLGLREEIEIKEFYFECCSRE